MVVRVLRVHPRSFGLGLPILVCGDNHPTPGRWLTVAYSYGVFQEWYLSSPDSPFRGASESAINAIGTITLGIQYMEGLGIMFFTQRYPHWTKPMMITSLIVCVGTMILSSFATQVWHLITLQGVVYGIAGGALYMPVVRWVSPIVSGSICAF